RIRLDRFEAERDVLPPVCIICGAPATVRKNKTFSWYPPWAGVFGIVALIMTQRMRVVVPFCALHRGHWLNRNLLVGLGFLGLVLCGLGGVIGLAIADSASIDVGHGLGAYFGLMMLLLFVAWLAGAIVLQYTSIRTVEITDRDITLIGVSDEFVDAV